MRNLFILSRSASQQTIYEAVELMLEKGYTPPVYRSANIDGGYEYNFAIEDKFADRIFHF